jgi:hypothetical protein
MYVPRKFSRSTARELAALITQAYRQFDAYLKGKPWNLEGGYALLQVVHYHANMRGKKAERGTVEDMDVLAQVPARDNGDIPMGFVARKGRRVYLVFRGTVTRREWIEDLRIKLVAHGGEDAGKVHG